MSGASSGSGAGREGLPIWTRWVRVKGATKDRLGELDVPVVVDEVLAASLAREQREAIKRERLRAGALSWEIDGLREKWAEG